MTHLISFYLTFTIILLCVLYAGVDNTLRLVNFIELKIKIQWIELRLWVMKQRLKRELKEAMKKIDEV